MSSSIETLNATVTQEAADTGGYQDNDVPDDALTKGTELGRYVVLRKIGAGGMGTVYLGYDPELDRKVALKLLQRRARASPRGLLREAQAMAKLRHPNVIAVHDVGQHEGHVYVAMDFVEGSTLQQWLQAKPRGWREVLEVFACAGRGLASAHDRGLIHRDFKPDNVMVSSEGHVLVMDFGLAQSSEASSSDPGSSLREGVVDAEIRSLRVSALNAETEGRLAGTPAYMAPEQVLLRDLSPATDQFSFCVSLWEGVCGQRPFDGEVLAEVFASASEGRIRSPPSGTRMPRWLERVLRRGLAPEPGDRWPSMEALLSILDQGRGRWRWQVGIGAAAVLAVAVGSLWGWRQQQEHARRDAVATCEARGAAIDEIWSEAQRERVRSGLLATEAPFAASSLETLLPWLDEYRDAWSSGRTTACLHRIDQDWDADRLDRSVWCFEDRRLQLEATVEKLATLERASARRAVRIASYLDPVANCLDPALLSRIPVPPVELRDEVRAIRAILANADRLRQAGRYDDAFAKASEGRERAEALGWTPVLARARLAEGRSGNVSGRFYEAEQALTHAYFEARNVGSVEVAFRSARYLIHVLASQERYREAEIWLRHAEVLSPEIEDPSGLEAAEGHYYRLRIYQALGNLDAAAEEGDKAFAMRAEILGDDHPITAAVQRRLALVYLDQQRFREALDVSERSLAIWEEAVGRDHPYVGELLLSSGRALMGMGYVERGHALQAEGVAINERVLRSGHPELAFGLDALSQSMLALSRVDEAEKLARRAAQIRAEQFGPHHPAMADSALLLASIDRHRGDLEAALRRAEGAVRQLEEALQPNELDIASAMERTAEIDRARGRLDVAVERRWQALIRREVALGSENRGLAIPLVQLGDVQRAGSQLEQARRSYERARVLLEGLGGGDGQVLAASLTGLAEVALALGDADLAQRFAERAVRVADDERVGPRSASAARFMLARALDATGDVSQPGRVRALAEQAIDEFTTSVQAEQLEAAERWLEVRP